MRWRWWLADAEPDRPSLRVKVHIRRTEHRPRIDEVGAESRGKTSHCPSPLTAAEGLIPAHTGKTHGRGLSLLGKKPHPRSRGENALEAIVAPASMGSSPLTRGKLNRGAPRDVDERLIPAHAGKTRGIRRPERRWGLIPAHAGKTASGREVRSRPRAHPRSRGENRFRAAWLAPPTGSSPLTRGKLALDGLHPRPVGLIPAHAGKTTVRLRVDWVRRSSSPLTRGKLFEQIASTWQWRLIPAHAGKTSLTARFLP